MRNRGPAGRRAFATKGIILIAASSTIGCSGATMMLKTPIADECATTGLEGCPEIAEGMLLYVEGDKPGAIKKLAIGAARNSPDQVKKFADALAVLQRVPGAEPYLAMIDEAVAVLTEHAGTDTTAGDDESGTSRVAWSPSSGGSAPGPTRGTLTADTDPARVVGGVTGLDNDENWATWCDELAGGHAACGSVEFGPTYLTDLVSLGHDCEGQFVAVVPAEEAPRFVLEGPFRIHGARLFVKPGEVLVIGQRGEPTRSASDALPASKAPDDNRIVLEETDPRYQCKLLWSGFKPYTQGSKAAKRVAVDVGY